MTLPFEPRYEDARLLAGAGLTALVLRLTYSAVARIKEPALFEIEPAVIYQTMVLGTGLGAPEFVTVNVLVALISLVVLFSPNAKRVALDSGLARRSPGLSPILTNRRRGS